MSATQISSEKQVINFSLCGEIPVSRDGEKFSLFAAVIRVQENNVLAKIIKQMIGEFLVFFTFITSEIRSPGIKYFPLTELRETQRPHC